MKYLHNHPKRGINMKYLYKYLRGGINVKFLYKYSNGNQTLHNCLVTKKTMLKEAQGSESCIINTISDDDLYLRSCGMARAGYYYTTVSLI